MFFDNPTNHGHLISGSSAFSKSRLNIWKFTVHTLLKPGLENFDHYFASVWDECNCVVVWTFFGIAFLWDWNENLSFPVLWALLSFPNLLAYWVQRFHIIIFYLFIYFNFNFYFILLYNTVLVLAYIDMNPPQDIFDWDWVIAYFL